MSKSRIAFYVPVTVTVGLFLAPLFSGCGKCCCAPRPAQPTPCRCHQKGFPRCDCEQGETCRCVILDKLTEAEMDAEALITTPGLAFASLPVKIEAPTQQAIERLCHRLEIFSDSKPWEWHKEKSHANWISWARNTYEYQFRNVHDYPQIDEADRLPKHEAAIAAYQASCEHLQWLYTFVEYNEAIQAMRWDTAERRDIWFCIANATDTSRHPLIRRRALHHLREATTPAVYYSGQWPTPYAIKSLPRW